LAGRLFPAVPVPFGPSADVHASGLERYAEWMAGQSIGGVAVWAHTGRGLRLADDVGDRGLRTWRRLLPSDPILIAAAGVRRQLRAGSQVCDSAVAMARRAPALGADALLVHPPVALRDRPDRDQLILDYHTRILEARLPILLFYLYEAAGGISYPLELLS